MMIYLCIVLYLFAGYCMLHLLADLASAHSNKPARFNLMLSIVFVFFWPIVMGAAEIRNLVEKEE